MRSGHASDRATAPGISTKRKRTNIATENQFMHSELHAFYGDVLALKNAEIRGKVLFDSTAEWAILIRKKMKSNWTRYNLLKILHAIQLMSENPCAEYH